MHSLYHGTEKVPVVEAPPPNFHGRTDEIPVGEVTLLGEAQPEAQPDFLRRGLQTTSNGYNERLGQCLGAKCAVWGDPHIVTCDDVHYDCQGAGTYTIMKNELINMQGVFQKIGEAELEWLKEHRNWEPDGGASMTTDVAMSFMPNGKDKRVQIGFGDTKHFEKDGETVYPTEAGCTPHSHYSPHMGGSYELNLSQCRESCKTKAGCAFFSYFPDKSCYHHPSYATQVSTNLNWGRSVSGPVDSECGILPEPEFEYKEVREKHGQLGFFKCPLIIHVDGEMLDISGFLGRNPYNRHITTYGKVYEQDDLKIDVQYERVAQWDSRFNRNIYYDKNVAYVEYKVAHNTYTTVKFDGQGNGPGEMWGCHFNIDVCLPYQKKNLVIDDTVGLLGTPNGDKTDEFMNDKGETLQYDPAEKTKTYDYCFDNWCVKESDSIFTMPPGWTWDHIMCMWRGHDEDDKGHCVMSKKQVEEKCGEYKETKPAFYESCKIDCCFGACPDFMDPEKYAGEDDRVIIEPEFTCVEDELENTPDVVCPTATSPIVRLTHASGPAPPEGKQIFYDMHLDAGNDLEQNVKFKINNPFGSTADVFVKYDERISTDSQFLAPTCDEKLQLESGCDARATEIEIGCVDHDGLHPYALVRIYFASSGFESGGDFDVDACCIPPEYDDSVKVIAYTFEIQCACPDTAVEL